MSTEKRMVGDTEYEVIQSMKIGDKEILLAENMAAEGGGEIGSQLIKIKSTNGIVASS